MDGALAQGTLYTQPHCTVLRQSKQGTLLVPHYVKQNTVGCPPQPKESSNEVVHAAKGVNVRDYRTQYQCEPEEKPRQLKVEIHSNSRSLSANNNSVSRSPRRSGADVKRAEPKYGNEAPASEHWVSRDAFYVSG